MWKGLRIARDDLWYLASGRVTSLDQSISRATVAARSSAIQTPPSRRAPLDFLPFREGHSWTPKNSAAPDTP